MRGQVIVSFGETDLASVQGSFELGADGVQVRVLSNNREQQPSRLRQTSQSNLLSKACLNFKMLQDACNFIE